MPPTIILVHGAFAESASWDGVIEPLQAAGHRCIAVANPLRGPASDASLVNDVISTVDGPVVLAAHSYGGAVITNVDRNAGDIIGLVYIASFAPDTGESANGLAAKFPGSSLGEALLPVPRADGTTDLYIDPDKFHAQFAADLSVTVTRRMAATQRPVSLEALGEPTGDRPLWKEVPSWFVIGEQDLNIPPALQRFLADRAESRMTLAIPEASHAVGVSHPVATSNVIREAAAAPVAA
jgi:pimeloyl-ACP methyl ester carboxylesterase